MQNNKTMKMERESYFMVKIRIQVDAMEIFLTPKVTRLMSHPA
jgi:hypothetical protein